MTHELFGPVISSYSRAQAIEDGVLVDITEQARQQRFVFPMAMTSALWDRCKAENAENLMQILAQLHLEIKKAAPGCDQLKFLTLGFTIKCVVGPGDDPRPVLTLCLPPLPASNLMPLPLNSIPIVIVQ